MYIKDPTKRVQYPFRVKEDLMEDLKAYAQAKDQKLPRVLNDLLTESLEGMNLSNTWLREELGVFITIPNEIPTKYPINLLNNDNDGLRYEIKAMPNNLASWNDKYGYISKTKNVLYEGVEPLLIPSFIDNLTLTADKDTAQTIAKCLFGIHILQYDNGQLHVELITINNAMGKLQFINNDMAKIFVQYRTMLNREINNALNHLNEVNHDKVKKELMEALEELAIGINTGNVVPITGNFIAYDNVVLFGQEAEDMANNNVLGSDNPYIVNDHLQKEIDQLKEENKTYKEAIKQLNADLNDVKARQEIWEEIKKENDQLKETLEKTQPIIERLEKLENGQLILGFEDGNPKLIDNSKSKDAFKTYKEKYKK